MFKVLMRVIVISRCSSEILTKPHKDRSVVAVDVTP